MAGLYVLFGNQELKRIQLAADELTFFAESEKTELITEVGFSCAWVSHDDPLLFGPAFDPASGVRVITSGRISWSAENWNMAKQMTNYRGGLSNRLVLENYIKRGIIGVERHNGPAILLIWDPRSREIHLFTDHFGYHPLFLYHPEDIGKCIISTLPDAIAKDQKVSAELDYVSMAEFLRAWRITPPHTYYQEIKYAGAATHWCWNLSTGRSNHRHYWEPFEEPTFPSLQEAADHLASTIRDAIHIRSLSHLGPIVSYTSGGMDSRAVLFSAADKLSLIGLNLFDKFNKEAEIARQLCEAAGVRYEGFARDNDYYPRWMGDGARLSGGMWSLEDNHFLGTREFLKKLEARTVISACTSDWLFKGYGLEKRHQSLFGKNLPLLEFTDKRVDGFLPNYPRQAPPEFATSIAERISEWFGETPLELITDRERLLVEDKRVRPACYTVSVSGQIMYRIFPYDTFLGDKRIADCYSRSRAEWKLNGDLWSLAIASICEQGKDIVDANYGWRVGSSYWQKFFMFGVGWIRRRLEKQTSQEGLATEGAWPNLSWYVLHSPTIRDFWESVSVEKRNIMSSLWGEDCWSKPLEVWASQPNDFFRLLTLLNHWQNL